MKTTTICSASLSRVLWLVRACSAIYLRFVAANSIIRHRKLFKWTVLKWKITFLCSQRDPRKIQPKRICGMILFTVGFPAYLLAAISSPESFQVHRDFPISTTTLILTGTTAFALDFVFAYLVTEALYQKFREERKPGNVWNEELDSEDFNRNFLTIYAISVRTSY